MIRRIAWRIVCLLSAVYLTFPPAYAFWQSRQQIAIAGGATFQGPMNISSTSPIALWGLQTATASSRGTKIVNACNSTGGVDVGCADLLSDATTGIVVPATVSGITCPGANCTVKTFYDTTGGTLCSGAVACDMTQATVAQRVTLDASCNGSLPCVTGGAGVNYSLVANLTSTQNTPYTFSVVYKRVATSGTQVIVGANAENIQFAGNGTDAGYAFAGSVLNFTATDAGWHSVMSLFSATGNVFVDGTGTGVATTGTTALGTAAPIKFYSTTAFTGKSFSAGIWGADITSTASAMSANDHTNCGC